MIQLKLPLNRFLLLWITIFITSSCDSEDASPQESGGMVAGEQAAGEQIAGEQIAGEQIAGEQVAGEQIAGEQVAGEQVAGEQVAGEQVAGEQVAGEQVAGEQVAGERVAGEEIAGEQVAGEQVAGEEMAGELAAAVCPEEWLELNDEVLISNIYDQLAAAYQPIIPEADLGGNINRYTTARALMFTDIERRENNDGQFGVYTIYTNYFVPLAEQTEPDHAEVNCEHTWPRSRLYEAEPTLYEHQQSDLHHLLPARAVINSLRGSNRFGEPTFVMEDRYDPALSGQDSDGHSVFAPMPRRRGDVARIIFYMSVRWGLDIIAHEEDTLRSWHESDPVDAWEQERNQRIEAYQGNRNPFIDCPQLVNLIADFTQHGFAEQESLPTP